MKKQLKISALIRSVVLFFLILLSFFLSYRIWFLVDVNNEPVASEDEQVKVTNNNVLQGVFIPKAVIQHQDETSQELSGDNASSSLHNQFCEFNFKNKEEAISVNFNQADYKKRLKHHSLEFIYQDHLNLKTYLSIYNILTKKFRESAGNFAFKRILLDFNYREALFINVKDQRAVKIKFTNSENYLQKVYQNHHFQKINLELTDPHLFAYQYAEDFKLKKYNFLVDSISISSLKSIFFKNNDRIYEEKKNQETEYSASDANVLFNSTNKKIKYKSVNARTEPQGRDSLSLSQRFIKNKSSLITLYSLRFFTNRQTTTSYRNFVNSHPVFGEGLRGEFNFTTFPTSDNNFQLKLELNSELLQIPIPSNEEITLPKTSLIFNQLQAKGIDLTKISDWTIGYYWRDLKEAKDGTVIELNPTYFVFYHNQWVPYQKLLTTSHDNDGKE